jgi:hypothetical protein
MRRCSRHVVDRELRWLEWRRLKQCRMNLKASQPRKLSQSLLNNQTKRGIALELTLAVRERDLDTGSLAEVLAPR